MKPSFCSFCSEPFVKKIAPKPATTARKITSPLPEQQSVEEAALDLPTSFAIKVESTPKLTTDLLKSQEVSFERGNQAEGAEIRNAAIQKMLDKKPVR